ncbi:MAG TPA: hypothetical protein DDW52_28500 [Planctomycetaceae bacterium]|nr:hypothetical protein [Planctomycetaceae bacterium]
MLAPRISLVRPIENAKQPKIDGCEGGEMTEGCDHCENRSPYTQDISNALKEQRPPAKLSPATVRCFEQ